MVTAVGLGLIRSDIGEFAWTGYLANLVSVQVPLLNANLGVWAALVLGFLMPVVSGIPRIRRQELEVAAVSARREELRDVLGLAD